AGDGGGEDAGGSVFEAAGELAGGLVGLEHADPGQLDALSVVQYLDGAGGEAASVSGPALPFAAWEAHRAPAAVAGLGIGVVLERSCQPVQSRLVGFLAVLSPPGGDLVLSAIPFPLKFRKCPWNRHARVCLALFESLLDQPEAPIMGNPGGTAVGGQGSLLPRGGIEGEPIGLEHGGHYAVLVAGCGCFICATIAAGWDSSRRVCTTRWYAGRSPGD